MAKELTKDQLYDRGYVDGYANVSKNLVLALLDIYEMGYVDGEGDRLNGVKTPKVKSAFIGDDFYKWNDPPKGYEFTGEHRTPQKGEIYLTKNGNAGVAKSDPKNGRQRHMLKAIKPCERFNYAHRTKCQFDQGHSGQCSTYLVK